MVAWKQFVAAFLCANVFGAVGYSDFESPLAHDMIEKGRRELEVIRTDASNPVHGACWLNALQELGGACDRLTLDAHHRIAMAFASCFLIKAGKRPFDCPREKSIAECAEGVDGESFSSYATFFLHCFNMCFYIRSQAWRSETGFLITQLSSSSAAVVEQLEEAGQKLKESFSIQQEILERQSSALAGLESLHSQGALLEENIKVSGQMFDEFRESVHSHETFLLSIFQRVADLEGFLMRELSLVSTVGFYVLGTILCYFFTSTRRTRDARFWTFVLLTFNAVVEYFVGRFYSRAGRMPENISDVSNAVTTWVWALRKLTASAIFCTLSWTAYNHQDMSRLNIAVMRQIHADNEEIRRLLLRMRRSPTPLNGAVVRSMVSAINTANLSDGEDTFSLDTGMYTLSTRSSSPARTASSIDTTDTIASGSDVNACVPNTAGNRPPGVGGSYSGEAGLGACRSSPNARNGAPSAFENRIGEKKSAYVRQRAGYRPARTGIRVVDKADYWDDLSDLESDFSPRAS